MDKFFSFTKRTYFLLILLSALFSNTSLAQSSKIIKVPGVRFDMPNNGFIGYADLRLQAVCGGDRRIKVAVDKIVVEGFNFQGNEYVKQGEYNLPLEVASGNIYIEGSLRYTLPGTSTISSTYIERTNISVGLQGFLDWIVIKDEYFEDFSCNEWVEFFNQNVGSGQQGFLNIVDEDCLKRSNAETCFFNQLVDAYNKTKNANEQLDMFTETYYEYSTDNKDASDWEKLYNQVENYIWPQDWINNDKLKNLKYLIKKEKEKSFKKETVAAKEDLASSSSELTLKENDNSNDEEEEQEEDWEDTSGAGDVSPDAVAMRLNLRRAELNRKAENAEANGNYGSALKHYQDLKNITRDSYSRSYVDNKINMMRIGYAGKNLLYGLIDQFLVSDKDPASPWLEHQAKEKAIIDNYKQGWKKRELTANYYNFLIEQVLNNKPINTSSFEQNKTYGITRDLLESNEHSLKNVLRQEKTSDSIYLFCYYYEPNRSADFYNRMAESIASNNLPGASFEVFENRIQNLGGPEVVAGTSTILPFALKSIQYFKEQHPEQWQDFLLSDLSPGKFDMYDSEGKRKNYYFLASTSEQEAKALKIQLDQYFEDGIEREFMEYNPSSFTLPMDYQFFRQMVENLNFEVNKAEGSVESLSDYLYYSGKDLDDIYNIIVYYLEHGYDPTTIEYGESLLSISFEAEDEGKLLKTLIKYGVSKEKVKALISDGILDYSDLSRYQVEKWLDELWQPPKKYNSNWEFTGSNNPLNFSKINIENFSLALKRTGLEKEDVLKIKNKYNIIPSISRSWVIGPGESSSLKNTDQYLGEYIWKDNGTLYRKIEVLDFSWGFSVDETEDYIFSTTANCVEIEDTDSDTLGGIFLAAPDHSSEQPSGINIQLQTCASLVWKPAYRLVFYRSGKIVKDTDIEVTNAVKPGEENEIKLQAFEGQYELYINGERVWKGRKRNMPAVTRINFFGKDKSLYSYSDLSLLAFEDPKEDVDHKKNHFTYDVEQDAIKAYWNNGSLMETFKYNFELKSIVNADLKYYLDQDCNVTFNKNDFEEYRVYKISESGSIYPKIFDYSKNGILLSSREYKTQDFKIKNGYHTYYYPDGSVKYKQEFFMDKLHNYLEAFDKNGDQLDTGNLKNGNGTTFFYDFENGVKISEVTYKNGKQIKEKNFEIKESHHLNDSGNKVYKTYYDNELKKVKTVKTFNGFTYQLEEFSEDGNLLNVTYGNL
jgi:antitoxin component YwqK of YwqJK toxin-antitoxin module